MDAVRDFDLELAARGISEARRRDHERLLEQLGAFLSPKALSAASADDLNAYLDHRAAVGYAPNTLRKERQMALAFFSWAYETNRISAETMIAMQRVVSPRGGTSRIRPAPYSAKELRIFREERDSRWPLMDDTRAVRFAGRWRKGVTPYARIRGHAIRLQLEAVIALALHCGLRRRELLALHLDDAHYDNAYLVVWQGQRWASPYREVPFTEKARDAVRAWIEFRACIGVEHESLWLNLWAEKTAREPIKPDAFAKLLSAYVAPELCYRRLRHTCGIAWLKAGMSLWEVQRLLGHARLKDTLPYGEAMKVDLERRVENLQEPFADALALAA